jgi:hypothetical protein
MKEKIPLKYACLDRFDEVYNSCQDDMVKTLLTDLRELIYYQMNQIKDQRMVIVAFTHKEAWKHYDNK